jgi:crossover junction endodeoxyribonuclease RuvC
MTVLLGIDPGSRTTGFGVIKQGAGDRLEVLTAGCIHLKQGDLASRLSELYQGVVELITLYRPDHAAVEQVFVKHYPAAALKLGHARGAIMVALAQHGVPIAEYAPRLVKKNVVGVGQADKSQVQHMISRMLGLTTEVPPDAADALAIAMCHANVLRNPLYRV